MDITIPADAGRTPTVRSLNIQHGEFGARGPRPTAALQIPLRDIHVGSAPQPDPVEEHMSRARRSTENVLRVAKEAIHALLDERDFLGLQLSHAHGELSDEELQSAVGSLGSADPTHSPDVLALKTARLAILLRGRIDADVVSTIFRCDIEAARTALLNARAALDSEGEGINHVLKLLWSDAARMDAE